MTTQNILIIIQDVLTLLGDPEGPLLSAGRWIDVI